MGTHSDLTYLWHLCKGLKSRAEYIPNNVESHYHISSNQKSSAKKAITWLLSKAPHTAEEIADHFEMSPCLITHLLEELKDANCVIKESVRSNRYILKEFKHREGEVS